MESYAFFVPPLAFSTEIAGVFLEQFKMRPDLTEVIPMRGKVERVVSELVEFLLKGRMRSLQLAMRGREGLRRFIPLAHIEPCNPVRPPRRLGARPI